MKLDFIVIGAQKSGSTYLQDVIEEHPEISMLPNEIPLLETPDYENGGLMELRNLLSKLDQSKIIGFKRPNYLTKVEVAPRIYEHFPNVKLIVMLRNPLDRFKSAYFHKINYGWMPILPLNVGTRLLLKKNSIEGFPRSEEIIEFGFYFKYLKDYLDIFPKENILILTFDEFQMDKMKIIKRCYEFLGVDQNFYPSKTINRTPQKVNYSLKRARFKTLRNKYKFKYIHNNTRLTFKNQSFFDVFVYNSISFVDKYFLQFIFSSKKPEFDEDLKVELRKIYFNDIRMLEEVIKVSLKKWYS